MRVVVTNDAPVVSSVEPIVDVDQVVACDLACSIHPDFAAQDIVAEIKGHPLLVPKQAAFSKLNPMLRLTGVDTFGTPGGVKLQSAQQALTVRFDPEVIAAFKATGQGWQARMNDALKDWLQTHSLA